MKKMIIFPGQGFQNMKMLTSEVQKFCFKNNMGDLLNEVLKDPSKLFDTEYAQPLIVATQLVVATKYKELQTADTEYIYAGFSLGEITALIVSGVIDVKEGLEFARQRGKITKEFSKNELQEGINDNKNKRKFSVVEITYSEGLEQQLSEFNSSQKLYDRINITNYIPDKDGKSFVTITGEENSIRVNAERFGKMVSPDVVIMQCPFHTVVLSGLIPNHKRIFQKCITKFNPEKLKNVYSTRKCEFYASTDTKETISSSLGEYLIQPIQQESTLKFFYENYPKSEIIVTMGETFYEQIVNQYGNLGGNQKRVRFVQDEIRELSNKVKC